MTRWFGATLIFALSQAGLRAGEPTAAQAEFFTGKVSPILAKNCFSCHSHHAKKARGGLMLDSRAGLLEGGDSGAAITPGQPDTSLLIQAIRHQDDRKMPPKAKLADADIAILVDWVKMGAPWPGKAGDRLRPAGRFSDEDRKWWAIQPLARAAPPKVDDAAWAVNPVDRFILARLSREGLRPAAPADSTALIRRVTFDLIGLPPSPAEVDAFVKDDRPDAYERLVDRLLASPAYGEHWARHWLDLVRYAESDGFRLDEYRPSAWRYRDYVIDAFNSDKPYDRFVQEQLAGDEIDPADPKVFVGTAFLRAGIYEYNQRDVRTQWQDILDDVTSVTGEVFLGLGMNCARCHDHKYDPILQRDYYRLQAFFAPIAQLDHVPLATPKELAAHRARLAAWEAKTAAVRKELDAFLDPIKKRVAKDAIDKFPKDIQVLLHKAEAERTPLEKQLAALAYRQVQWEFDYIDKHIKDEKQKKRHQELVKQLAAFDADKPAPLPTTLTSGDIGPVAPATFIPKKAAKLIEPGFLSILTDTPAEVAATPTTTGRRLALARWLTQADHPLTSRVLVNRLWQQLFGRGLAASANDFGRLGDPPTHPELLDWLAVRFVEEGWSIKKMVRLLITSQAYRQTALREDAEAATKDPENLLLWRARSRRLAAEQIRDAILSATGRLDHKVGGASVDIKEPRRTVYVKIRRNARDPLLDVFDAPDGFGSTAKRNVTTTPVQALLLLNSPFMVEQASAFADRLTREHAAVEGRIDGAFRLAFGRPATKEELVRTQTWLPQQALRAGGGEAGTRAAFVDFCQMMLNANEFVYLD